MIVIPGPDWTNIGFSFILLTVNLLLSSTDYKTLHRKVSIHYIDKLTCTN